MRQSRFTQTEIVYVVKQVEMGISIKEVARKYGVCENTVYQWRKKYDGLSPSELKAVSAVSGSSLHSWHSIGVKSSFLVFWSSEEG